MAFFAQNYPRDLRGYADNRRTRSGRTRRASPCSLSSIMKRAENHVLHGDAGSEQFLSDIIGAASYGPAHVDGLAV
jgi:allantoinase